MYKTLQCTRVATLGALWELLRTPRRQGDHGNPATCRGWNLPVISVFSYRRPFQCVPEANYVRDYIRAEVVGTRCGSGQYSFVVSEDLYYFPDLFYHIRYRVYLPAAFLWST